MRRGLVFGLALVVVLPVGVVGYQLAQVADPTGCPSRLAPSPGPLRLRLVVENAAQAAALDLRALTAYLADRLGRAVEVVSVAKRDATAFRLDAAARPVSQEALVFFAFQPFFPRVQTAHGLVDALGFATPGTACAYVTLLPSQPTLCLVGRELLPLQPGYAYLAHELGHLLGLRHAEQGLMGKGVFELCSGDRFTAEERAWIQSWGRA